MGIGNGSGDRDPSRGLEGDGIPVLAFLGLALTRCSLIWEQNLSGETKESQVSQRRILAVPCSPRMFLAEIFHPLHFGKAEPSS